MMAYALISNLFSLNNNKQKSLFLTIAFFHLLFLHTFFDASVFPDLDNYYQYFSLISNPNAKSTELEIGWNIINRALYSISTNSFILLFTVSFAMIYFYLKTIKRYSDIAWISVFILLCTVFYNSLFVLRQNLAIPLCLMTIPYIIERKPVKFSLLTLLAISIHFSAIVWFIAYFIYSFKLNKLFYILLTIFSILIFQFFNLILENLILISTNIMAYSDSVDVSGLSILKSTAVNLSALLLCLYSYGSFDRITGYNKLFFQLISISLFLGLLPYFGAGFTLFDRLSLYFSISSMFLIPNSLANLKKHKLFHYLIFVPVICVFYLFFLNGIAQYGYNLKF
tara:strand:- start:186 stop:1202 length:1017 start_codon:yes stop_codon:yes gene_type:complete